MIRGFCPLYIYIYIYDFQTGRLGENTKVSGSSKKTKIREQKT